MSATSAQVLAPPDSIISPSVGASDDPSLQIIMAVEAALDEEERTTRIRSASVVSSASEPCAIESATSH